MPRLTRDSLRLRGEAFMEALSREHYLASAGFKPRAELRPIYERFRDALGDEALALVRELFLGAAEGSEERQSARSLLDWQVESHASRALAELDESIIAWENGAVVRTATGESIPYQRAPIAIATARTRTERLALDEARAALVAAELAPRKAERLQREREIVERLEIAPDYVGAFEALNGIELDVLAEQCDRFLGDTRGMWDEMLPVFLKRQLGVSPQEATRADALALFRAAEFDAYFPAADMERQVRRQTEEMGLDPLAGGRVRLDTAEREGKRSRAFCAPVRVPHEVYLVLRPHGGAADWRTFLHELGHALHFASMRDDLPFEHRWLGDNSITEGFAMLFDHRMHDRGWLLRYTELGRTHVAEYLRAAAFEELHFLRRYCAKLRYELALYDPAMPWSAAPDLYVETLSAATTFRYRPADAFIDIDPRFYAARYLRAWQLQAALAESLERQFDADWWRNPRAGPWLATQLLAEGQRELASQMAERVGQGPLTFAPLIRAIERDLS